MVDMDNRPEITAYEHYANGPTYWHQMLESSQHKRKVQIHDTEQTQPKKGTSEIPILQMIYAYSVVGTDRTSVHERKEYKQ